MGSGHGLGGSAGTGWVRGKRRLAICHCPFTTQLCAREWGTLSLGTPPSGPALQVLLGEGREGVAEGGVWRAGRGSQQNGDSWALGPHPHPLTVLFAEAL